MKDILFILAGLTFIIAFAYGWIANLVTIYHTGFSDIDGELIIRIVGIFMAPIGAVMGFIS